jgi:pullulanase/glycogen debranching enzyme
MLRYLYNPLHQQVRQYISPLPDKLRVHPGKSHPLGATWDGAGVNFAIFSEYGTRAYVCLFDNPNSTKESHKIPLPEYNDFVYHGYFPDVRPGQVSYFVIIKLLCLFSKK